MKKISSKRLFVSKKVFPVIWFGFLAVFILEAVLNDSVHLDPMFLIAPCAMAVFGALLMRKLLWDLVDEVYDCGDALLVRNGGKEERVPLTNIMNVSASMLVNPPRVSLRLVKPGRFGNEISFSPAAPFTLNPFAKNKIAEDLMVRVDHARRQRTN